MGRTYYGNDKKIKAYYGNKKVLSMWYGSIRVYPNAGEVTYYVDSGVVYTEEIDIDNSCLTPTTFTPTKSGWTFVGWREDSTASSSVLSEKKSDGNNYTLYAVFKQNVTITKYNGSSSATTESKTRYYNNTNVANPSFTLSQNNLSGWTAKGWSTSSSATASASVSNGGSVTLSANATYYGLYQRTITLTKYNGSSSATTSTGTRYWNSAGNYSNPKFTLTQTAVSGWTVRGWSTSTSATASASVSNGGSVTLSSNATYYGMYQRTITLSYNGNGATGGSTASQSGTRYWNSAGNYSNPSFTLRSNGYSRTYYSFVNWRMGSASGTAYNAGASVTLSASTVFYASWKLIYVNASVKIYGGCTLTRNDGINVWPYSPQTDGRSDMWDYSRQSMPSDSVISWSGDYFSIKANYNCTVKITGTMRLSAPDRGAQHRCRLFVNGSVVSTVFDIYVSRLDSTSTNINTSINLSAGQILTLRCNGGNDDNVTNARAMFESTASLGGGLTISATIR